MPESEIVELSNPYKWRIFMALQAKPPGEIYSGSVRGPEKSRRRERAKVGRRAARLNRTA